MCGRKAKGQRGKLVWGQGAQESSRAAEDGLGAAVRREARGLGAGCQATHNEGAGGAEGEGAAGVEVGGVERDQDADKVETLSLEERENSGLKGHLPQTPGPPNANAPSLPGGKKG